MNKMKTNNIVIGVLLVVVLFLLCKPCMCNETYSAEKKSKYCSIEPQCCDNYIVNACANDSQPEKCIFSSCVGCCGASYSCLDTCVKSGGSIVNP